MNKINSFTSTRYSHFQG